MIARILASQSHQLFAGQTQRIPQRAEVFLDQPTIEAIMDEESVEKAGLAPIQERLDRIARITSLSEIAGFATAQHRAGTGDGLIFGFSSGQDYENSQSVIAFASRGELGLPDRDYYSKTDPKSVEIRQKYVDHMFGGSFAAFCSSPPRSIT